MNELVMVSLMADNARPFYRALGQYIDQNSATRLRVVDDSDWLDREKMLDDGSAHLGFVCGLQYLHKPNLELLAAPVMSGSRYAGRPVYYSDVLVASTSPYQRFGDLAGCTFAYNEATSHSGCNLIRFHLARLGQDASFFGRILESGSHQRSLELILDDTAHATAIDSTVLELEMIQRPELRSTLRTIDTLGPSPIPPAVVSRKLPRRVKRELRDLLVGMHDTDPGKAILNQWMMLRFARVSDRDYEPIRGMEEKAFQVSFP